MSLVTAVAALWWLIVMGVLAGTAVLALSKARQGDGGSAPEKWPPLSMLLPLKDDSPALEPATRSIFAQDYPTFDLVIGATDEASAAVDHVLSFARKQTRRPFAVMRTRPAPPGVNPKIANLLQPYASARYDLLVLKDANTILPPRHLQTLVEHLDERSGLVCSAPIMRGPESFAAWIECAIVNGHGARHLLAASRLGIGVGIGAVMLVRRPALDRCGGLAAIADRLADDHAITRQLARIGLRTRMTGATVDQIVGVRTLPDVIQRQVRWSACRRTEEPLLFTVEPLIGGLAATIAAGLAAAGLGLMPVPAMLATLLAFVGVEVALSRAMRWPVGARLVPAILCREILVPVIWFKALSTPGAAWRVQA
jgi:ceramide glucosyltransferase